MSARVSFRSACVAAALGLGVVCTNTVVTAQAPGEDLAGASVRQLTREADEAFKSGDFTTALDKFEKAYAVVQVPTVGLFCARSLEKLGRLVEASERYAEVGRLPLPAKKPEVHKQAQEDAAAELTALLPRIPHLIVSAVGQPAGASISLDGRPLAADQLGKDLAVDPGTRKIELVFGTRVARRELAIAERETKRVEIALEPEPVVPAPSLPPTAVAPGTNPSPPLPPPPPRAVTGLAIAGWVGIGVGGAGLALGAITAGVSWEQNEDLDQSGACLDDICLPSAQEDVDSYNQNRIISTTGFIVGSVAVAAGATLLIIDLATASSEPAAPTIHAWLSPEAAGIAGSF